MVLHFRNSVPQEFVQHPSIATAGEDQTWLQSSFSSSDDKKRNESKSTEAYDEQRQNISRASSILDLLNPVEPTVGSSLPESQTPESTSTQPVYSNQTDSNMGHPPSEQSQSYPASSDSRPPVNPSNSPPLPHSNDAHEQECLGPPPSHEDVFGPEERTASALQRNDKVLDQVTASTEIGNKAMPITNRSFDKVERFNLPETQPYAPRLSMALDGVVKVKTTEEETPSPPKPPSVSSLALRKDGLKRSHSAATSGELLKEQSRRTSAATSGVFGRSRDARAWKFYCDHDTRTALAAQAENDSNGSAAGAINLIRSRSQTNHFKPRGKGNETVLKSKRGAENVRRGLMAHKPVSKLARTLSSTADLATAAKPKGDSVYHASHVKPQMLSPSGDSDKENWAPGTTSSSHLSRRAKGPNKSLRKPLQEDFSADRQAGSCAPLYTETSSSREYQHPVAASSRGNMPLGPHNLCRENSPGQGEELDCVQGLLSLSQGAWK